MTDATPLASEQIAASLTPNQRMIVLERDLEIDSRRARTRARNDVRALRLMWSEGYGLTPLGKEVAAALSATQAPSAQDASQAQGEVDAIARELLKGAVMRRDATGASLTKHDRDGEVDVGAAVDAIMVAIRMTITAPGATAQGEVA